MERNFSLKMNLSYTLLPNTPERRIFEGKRSTRRCIGIVRGGPDEEQTQDRGSEIAE